MAMKSSYQPEDSSGNRKVGCGLKMREMLLRPTHGSGEQISLRWRLKHNTMVSWQMFRHLKIQIFQQIEVVALIVENLELRLKKRKGLAKNNNDNEQNIPNETSIKKSKPAEGTAPSASNGSLDEQKIEGPSFTKKNSCISKITLSCGS